MKAELPSASIDEAKDDYTIRTSKGILPAMRSITLGRVASFILTAGGWILVGARTVLDLIGYSTAPQDAEVATGIASRFLVWLMGLPWFAPWLVAFAATALLIWASRRTERETVAQSTAAPLPPREPASADPLEATEGAAHERLIQFASLFLLPACAAQIKLQREILLHMSGDGAVKELAVHGLYSGPNQVEFHDNYETLSELQDSPTPEMTLRELMTAIAGLENDSYRRFCTQRSHLTLAAKIYSDDHPAYRKFEAWAKAHDAMVAEFDNVKTVRAYDTDSGPSLYRPAKTSRWGKVGTFAADPN